MREDNCPEDAPDVAITIDAGRATFSIRESIPEFLCFESGDMDGAINALLEALRKALVSSCREHVKYNKDRTQ